MSAWPDGWYQMLGDVQAEIERQDAKWGQQLHDPFVWLAVLSEEVGEFSQAILTTDGKESGNPRHEVGEFARRELVQVAAVALQALWSLDLQGYWGAAYAQTGAGE